MKRYQIEIDRDGETRIRGGYATADEARAAAIAELRSPDGLQSVRVRHVRRVLLFIDRVGDAFYQNIPRRGAGTRWSV